MTDASDPRRFEEAAVHAPIGRLPQYFDGERARLALVSRLFNEGARDYERMERWLSLGLGAWYRREALRRAGLKPGQRVIDVGIGTGLTARGAVELVGDAALVTGVDPSPGMVGCAQLPCGVRLLAGTAEAIPAPDASCEFLSMGYALRHIGDLEAAFREFHRVLAPGGRLCVLEVTPPENRLAGGLLRFHLGTVAPALGRLFGRSRDTAILWRYYWDTINACAPPSRILATLALAGFTQVERHVQQGIFSEYRAVRPA